MIIILFFSRLQFDRCIQQLFTCDERKFEFSGTRTFFFHSCPNCRVITNLTELKQALRGMAALYSCAGCVLYNCDRISWDCAMWQSCQEVMDSSLC